MLDPVFPCPDLSANRKITLNALPQEVKYELVFDEEYLQARENESTVSAEIRSPTQHIEKDLENNQH